LRAEGQNTLVLNPSNAPDQDPTAAAKIVRFNSSKNDALAIADLSSAYRRSARRVWRGVRLVNRKFLLVQDEIQADKPVDAWWFMHTPAAVSIDGDGRSATLQQVGARLRAQIIWPEKAVFQLKEAQPLPESPHPARQARNEAMRKLAIHLDGLKAGRLVVVLTPVTEGRGEGPTELRIVDLSEWKSP
jgi:hypothetical protein